MKKNILIVDDHPIVSTGLQALIEHTGEYGKIYVTNNITSSRLLLRQKDIDIAIIDLGKHRERPKVMIFLLPRHQKRRLKIRHFA